MKQTKISDGVVTRSEALQLAPNYVRFIEGEDYDLLFNEILPKFDKLKRGQMCLTFCDKKYVKVKVVSVNRNDPRAIDGPVVRVANSEFSWRVDGTDYAYPI